MTLKPDGKLSDTPEARTYASFLEAFAEMERSIIKERTERGRIIHAEKRLPSAGRGGPPFGYQWKDTTHTTFVETEQEAETLRWMFAQIDENEQASARWLAGELNRRGIPTRAGNRWTSATVVEKLRNPIYCGQGRMLRWKSEWMDVPDKLTGEVFKVWHVSKRPISETFPISQDAVPILVVQALFERVQQKIDARRWFVVRLGRSDSPHKPKDTLLHGGLVRCASCGRAMVRYWQTQAKMHRDDPLPYYRCNRNGSDPSHSCTTHSIPARAVDQLVLHLIAFALTDPVKVLELADASERYYTAALDMNEQTANQIAALQNRLGELDDERTYHRRVLAALDSKIDAKEVEERQAKLAKIASEQAQIEGQLTALKPQQTRAAERAALLKALTMHKRFLISFERGTITPQGDAVLPDSLPISIAARLTGSSSPGEQYNDYRRQHGMGVLPVEIAEETVEAILENEGRGDLPTYEALEELLRNAPIDAVRKLLWDMGVVVKVSRPSNGRYGRTPVAKRVVVEIFGDGNGEALRLCADEGNGSSFQQYQR